MAPLLGGPAPTSDAPSPTAQTAAAASDVGSTTAPAPGGAAPLPKRRVATAQISFPAAGDARIGAPNRPADEIRSILSAYRSGLTSGRAEANGAPLEPLFGRDAAAIDAALERSISPTSDSNSDHE
jgi:hypothetical protein